MTARPTNAWYEALIVGSGRHPVHTVPYLVVSNDTGLDVCMPALDTTSYTHAVIAPMVANMSLRATPALSAPKVTAIGDLGCTVTWTGGGAADVVRGAAYATMRYTSTRPVLATTHAITSVNGTGVDSSTASSFTAAKFKLVLNNGQTWLAYFSASVTLTIASGQTLTAGAAFTGTARVAILPIGTGAEAALDAGATAVHTGGTVAMSVAGATYTKTLTWTFSGTGTPLTYAMPHHQDVLVAPTYPAGTTLTGTMRGTLKAVSGTTWTLNMLVTMPGWNNANPIRSDRVAAVQAALDADQGYIPTAYPYSINDTMADPYFGSKWQAKAARLALVADQLGDTAARDQLLGNLKTVLSRFLLGNDPGTKLRYDTVWGGVVSEKGLTDGGVDFGNGRYNDHYFHYGYLVYAAAVIARYDSAWATTYRTYINDLIRDIANPSPADVYFTTLRHFDLFEGHSWASGNNEDAQANQESTSEAVNAWYGIYLWGLATSQSNLVTLGQVLFTEEVRTAQRYWQILQSNALGYPTNIRNYGCVGIVWSFKYEVSTWFSIMPAQLEHVHGIQLLPITPATELLVPDAWMTETWTNNLLPLLSRTPAVELPWWNVLVTAHGQTDPNDAWTRLAGVAADRASWDDGTCKTLALYHVATQG